MMHEKNIIAIKKCSATPDADGAPDLSSLTMPPHPDADNAIVLWEGYWRAKLAELETWKELYYMMKHVTMQEPRENF